MLGLVVRSQSERTTKPDGVAPPRAGRGWRGPTTICLHWQGDETYKLAFKPSISRSISRGPL